MISLEGNEIVVESPELRIYDNTLIYDDNVIQLENVARISVAPMEKRKVPTWAIGCILAGLLLMSFGALGFCLLVVGVVVCVYVIYKNSQLGYYLTLELNSGRLIYFNGKTPEFLKKIMKVLAECINSKSIGYTINMGQAKIDKIQLGDNNQMQ